MTTRLNTVRRKELPYEIKTVNGNKLHSLSTHADSEYLVIDLGNAKGRRSDFHKTMEVAMRAAMNAVLASMPELVPLAKKGKAINSPQVDKPANEVIDGMGSHTRRFCVADST